MSNLSFKCDFCGGVAEEHTPPNFFKERFKDIFEYTQPQLGREKEEHGPKIEVYIVVENELDICYNCVLKAMKNISEKIESKRVKKND